jgi:phosphoenolpyruvate phosphomutase
VTEKIFNEQSVRNIEKDIASLDDIFALTNEWDVQAAEKKYATLHPREQL